MDKRISDKVKEIEGFVDDLSSYMPSSFEEYVRNSKTKDACEHCFEKIVEALADLAFIIIRLKKWDLPKDDIGAFFVLSKNNIISNKLAEKLKDAKGMRNIIAHEYGKVNDEEVFEAVSYEISEDVREFLNSVKGIN